ncbi:MAG: hypothetical protein H7832_11150 [Magnetococcus sp. DMHC-6]
MGIPALFEARGGLSIGVHLITDTGVPGSSGGRPDTAVVGSIYLDQTTGQLYTKNQTGTGSNKWTRIQNQLDLDQALLGLSWREPAKLYDNSSYENLAAAEIAINTGMIDGVAIANGDRILFDGIAGNAKNLYIVSGVPGSEAILVEDGNAATKGDAIYIEEGSVGGRKYSYNGSSWVQSGAAERSELGYLRHFVGKNGEGTETPDYSSVFIVSDGDSLETGIGKLDAEIGAAIATPQNRTVGSIRDQAVNLNLEALDDAIGADVTSTNQISSSATIQANLSTLDLAIGDDITSPASRTVGAIAVQDIHSNLEALDHAIGSDITSHNYLSTANTVHANLSALDHILGQVKIESEANSVTTATTVDAVKVDEVLLVEWNLHACSIATPTTVWSGKLLALHNGTTNSDATDVDYNLFAVLKSGPALAGLDFDVDLNGSGSNQLLRLRASCNSAVHVRVTRSVLTMA